jgi:hypothetical protein
MMRKEAPHRIDPDFKDVDGMTLADWRARASLLGMSYYRGGHYLYYVPAHGPTERFDADTLRPISAIEARDGPMLFFADGRPVPEDGRYDREFSTQD